MVINIGWILSHGSMYGGSVRWGVYHNIVCKVVVLIIVSSDWIILWTISMVVPIDPLYRPALGRIFQFLRTTLALTQKSF